MLSILPPRKAIPDPAPGGARTLPASAPPALLAASARAGLLGVLLLLGAPGCTPEPEPEPEPTAQPAPAASPRGLPPSVVVIVTAQDPGELLGYLTEFSGYIRVFMTDPSPPIEDPTLIGLSGERGYNPVVSTADTNGSGIEDGVIEVVVTDLQPSDPLVEFGIGGLAGIQGTRFGLTVSAYNFSGEELATFTSPDQFTLEERSEPELAILGPLGLERRGSCDDDADDDGDGWTDTSDPDCSQGAWGAESGFGTTPCNDGLDNDGDGSTDGADEGCSRALDLSEQHSCEDGIDDDGDGWTDAADPDCQAAGASETGLGSHGCNDGADNDDDGLTDALDPDCTAATGDED